MLAAALGAFQTQEWEVAIALTDADSIESVRRIYLDEKARRFELPPRQSWEPADPLREQIEELMAMAADEPVTFHELAGVATLEEAEALGTTEFMVRWAQARHDLHLATATNVGTGPIEFHVSDPLAFEAVVRDLRGSIVWQRSGSRPTKGTAILLQPLAAGAAMRWVTNWNQRDNEGRAVRPGLYDRGRGQRRATVGRAHARAVERGHSPMTSYL